MPDQHLVPAEKLWRRKTVRSAIASVRLENLEPSELLVRDLEEWQAGALSLKDVGTRLFARFEMEDRARGGL